MDSKSEFEELIRKSYTALIDDFSECVEDLCNALVEKDIITKSMRDNILSHRTCRRQSSELLDLIPSRGKRAHKALYEVCKAYGRVRSADILRPDQAPHVLQKDSRIVLSCEEIPIPDDWLTEENKTLVENGKLSVKNVDNDSQMLRIYQDCSKGVVSNIYPMTHRKRGKALIIVNEIFPITSYKPREGSKIDLIGLKQLFNLLGFEVCDHKNVKAEKIEEILTVETLMDHRDHDCFALFISSYGKTGVVLGSDAQSVEIESIVEKFSTVEDLKNKPKLFFFQACQGENDDTGTILRGAQAREEDESLGQVKNSKEKKTDNDKLTIPHREHCFIFRSSPDGTRSNRHTQRGSWFTQAIILVFAKYAHKDEFSDLCNKVKQLVAIRETVLGIKNIPELMTSRCKLFYFFPGLYEKE